MSHLNHGRPKRASPLRHVSFASTASSSDLTTHQENDTVTFPYSSLAGQKRNNSERSPERMTFDHRDNIKSSRTSASPRESLRTIAQGPAALPVFSRLSPPSQDPPMLSMYAQQSYESAANEPEKKSPYSTALTRSESQRDCALDPGDRNNAHGGNTSPQQTLLESSEMENWGKSSTGHLRALSKLAEEGDLAITSPNQEVVGLQGRRRLQRNMSTRGKKPSSAPGYGGKIWMDQQRQFLQAYEYLCHIGEAKEWIEDIVHKSIPAIVQLEEALRDGVTLAEIVQALNPDRTIRIFRHAKLQFRHSDNIAVFFRFLADVELPELFRFELVDLYEKKNIPKVIHCIHALSWLLYRRGLVDFRIGNLVGKLQFEDHELEATQKGLDKAGVSMPNFSGMGANFGAEPEPDSEPVETEEQRIEREIRENESNVVELQSQLRGAIIRLRLGDTMEALYDSEEVVAELQSRIRGDFARQISEYRKNMQRFATDLQRHAKGFLVRMKEQGKEDHCRAREPEILLLQSLVRAGRERHKIRTLQSSIRIYQHSVLNLQAAIRGCLRRRQLDTQHKETQETSVHTPRLQGALRGYLLRKSLEADSMAVELQQSNIRYLQAFIRGKLARADVSDVTHDLTRTEHFVNLVQNQARGALLRKKLDSQNAKLCNCTASLVVFQAVVRGAQARHFYQATTSNLDQLQSNIRIFQSMIRSHLLRELLAKNMVELRTEAHHIIQFQSTVRGYLQRVQVFEQLSALDNGTAQIIELQSFGRAVLLRARVADTLESLDDEDEAVSELQGFIRGNRVRQRFVEKKEFFKQNMSKVIKLQSFVRARQQGEAYKSLMNGKNPPVGTVKNFVHLLNDSDFDFEEELESERVRKSVVLHVRQNELIEQYIEELDTKIGLVQNLKNRRDELVRLQKTHGSHISNLLTSNSDAYKNTLNFKPLNKSSKHKVELYQEMFFILQTQPQYLARLFRRGRERGITDEESKRLEMLIMSMFGFAQKRREEYYLLRVIVRGIREEADGCTSLQEFQRGSFFWSRLFANYIRSPKDRKFLRELFGPFIKTRVVESPDLDLESDPLQIYRSLINNEELRTGQRSVKNPDLSREEAIREPETRAIFILHLQDLRDLCDIFMATLEELIQRMPFAVRYTAQQMYEITTTRFPDEDTAQILQSVGQWLWKTYLKPGLTDSEALGVVDRGLNYAHKRNLAEFAKTVNQIVSGKHFGSENDCLKPLNSYVTEAVARLHALWIQTIDVQDPELHFDIDEFNDLYARNKPTLFIKLADVFAIHQTIATDISYICTTYDDALLRDLINELGSAKVNEMEMMNGKSMEITLQLSPKLHNLDDPEAPIKALFMETKRCVLYIIRIQTGENLLDIMVKPVSAEDEAKWAALVREELAADSQKRGAYSETKTLVDVAALSYTELKRTALENILHLEQSHRLSRQNNYQDLLNEIALDIRTKHRRRVQRRRELEGLQATLSNLLEKKDWLDEKLKAYNDAFEQNLTTLQNKKGKKRFLMPFSKQWDHERELARMGKSPQFGSYRYSGMQLFEKGILIEWNGVNLRENDLILSSDEVGVFHIDGVFSNLAIPGASATFTWDDMLGADVHNQQYLTFFKDSPGAGQLKLNANLLQTQISKKFWRND